MLGHFMFVVIFAFLSWDLAMNDGHYVRAIGAIVTFAGRQFGFV